MSTVLGLSQDGALYAGAACRMIPGDSRAARTQPHTLSTLDISMRIRPLLFLVCCLLLVNTPLPASVAGAQEPGRRIVGIGDVHGAYNALVDVLGETGLVDDSLAWSGGDAVLVQTGDLLDGGSGVRPVLDLMMRLQTEARAAGGEVIVLLGDHEVLSILGELRDASPETFVTFAAENQTELLREAFQEFEQAYLRMEGGYGQANRSKKENLRDQWVENQVPGRVEYIRAMGPDGTYGKWLRTLPVTATVDGILFLHASIAPQLAAWSPHDINQRLTDEIAMLDAERAHLLSVGFATTFGDIADTIHGITNDARGLDWFDAPREMLNKPPALPTKEFDQLDRFERSEPVLRINGWFMLAPRGPIWSKGFAESPEGMLEATLPGLLEATGTKAIVAGHVPSEDGAILSRAGGKLFLIDTDMSQGGKAAALVITGGQFEAVYVDGTRQAMPVLE